VKETVTTARASFWPSRWSPGIADLCVVTLWLNLVEVRKTESTLRRQRCAIR